MYIIDDSFNVAYGPFSDRRVAMEYAAEIGYTDERDVELDDTPRGLRVKSPSVEFYLMVQQPGYFD
jgi:hypothetical protein